jgi:hypothetical protein
MRQRILLSMRQRIRADVARDGRDSPRGQSYSFGRASPGGSSSMRQRILRNMRRRMRGVIQSLSSSAMNAFTSGVPVSRSHTAP